MSSGSASAPVSTTASNASVPTASTRSTVTSAAASAVDRFLAGRTQKPVPPPNCGCGSPAPAKAAEGSSCCSAPDPDAAPPAKTESPSEPAVDFVCEDDVRLAIAAKRKIRLKPKAILTPSARDLGERLDVFIR